MTVPLPSKDNPLVSMGPCPELLLDTHTLRFKRPYPKMAMMARGDGRGRDVIYVFRAPEHPGVQGDLDEAIVRRFERFNRRRVRSVSVADLELSGWKHIGKCIGEVYCSNKEGRGSEQEYIHEHNRPLPDVYSNRDRNVYVIIGGKFNIDEWIEG